MSDTEKHIDCVLVPQFETQLLLPRASVVQVIDSEKLDIVVDLQGGVLGKLQWQGWTIPLVSFESILNGTIPKFNRDTKAVILHSLIDDAVTPYIAVTSQGVPQDIEISEAKIDMTEMSDSDFIQSKVYVNSDIQAYIPELPVLVTYTAQFI